MTAHGQQYLDPSEMNTDRIYQGEDERWYFNVRGNPAKGPYASYIEAEDALNVHVRQCRRPLATPSWAKALKPTRRHVSEARHP